MRARKQQGKKKRRKEEQFENKASNFWLFYFWNVFFLALSCYLCFHFISSSVFICVNGAGDFDFIGWPCPLSILTIILLFSSIFSTDYRAVLAKFSQNRKLQFNIIYIRIIWYNHHHHNGDECARCETIWPFSSILIVLLCVDRLFFFVRAHFWRTLMLMGLDDDGFQFEAPIWEDRSGSFCGGEDLCLGHAYCASFAFDVASARTYSGTKELFLTFWMKIMAIMVMTQTSAQTVNMYTCVNGDECVRQGPVMKWNEH